ncbi:MAG: FRG domain-containing protein [Candidatus Acidiferrales bacterium]|jgi:hypothetical protein
MPEGRQLLGPVNSTEELLTAVASISTLHPKSLLLFRGQDNLPDTLRSGLSRPDVRYEQDVDNGISALAGSILGHESVTAGNIPFRKAVLQHYGYKTHYVDLTTDPGVAAWFATNTGKRRPYFYLGSAVRMIEQISYSRRDEGEGFLVVLAVPNPEALQTRRRLFDISSLKPFLRPSRQRAWLAYDRPPLLPDPNDFWIATIRIDCSKFTSAFTSRYLFPPPAEDEGFRSLLNIPFVEAPDDWKGTDKDQEKRRRGLHDFCAAVRSLPIPEYEYAEKNNDYDHKWSDQTLTEAKPMQVWVRWKFDLSQRLSGVTGDISEATKITLSPRAHDIVFEPPPEVPLRWPSVGTDELFFTFAQYGHDKVDEIQYPYRGVWLHRDKDLIIEHPMSAGRRKLNAHAGHVFEFIGQDLLRQDLPSSCRCTSPSDHEARVRAMLSLSALVEAEYVILLPHPLKIPNWYYAL